MSTYQIRYNKSRGHANRGTIDHVWRVFEDGKEYLFKNFEVNVPCKSEKDGEDYNLVCEGVMHIDRDSSTAIINKG